MKNYELTYLISNELTEEEAQNLQNKIVSYIQEEGGILINQRTPIKKTLAYPVKKKSQAYLAVISYQLLPEKLSNLEKKIKTEFHLLRYLIVVLPTILPSTKPKPKLIKPVIKPSPTKQAKVELKEIEKKLDEILDIT
ncbi:MAG: 30S ribosomal protein S6 [Minisyncoccales bacterium]